MASGSIKKITSISYVDVVYPSLAVSASGMTALTLSQTFPTNVIGVEITRSWPLANWNVGALVNIVQWDYIASDGTVDITLSTTSEQSYGVTFRVYYEG